MINNKILGSIVPHNVMLNFFQYLKIDSCTFAAQLLGDSLKMLHLSILTAYSRRSLSSG